LRLNRFLAQSGLGSRRSVENWIRAGRVRVNGAVAELGALVGETDRVEVDGKAMGKRTDPAYFLFNKPSNCLCSRGDTHGRRTVYDLLPGDMLNLHYVGRLDKDSRGLLFFTSDGDLTEKLTHPRHAVLRLYEVRVDGDFSPDDLLRLRHGVEVEPGVVFKCASVQSVPEGYRLGLREGKKREIRRLLAALGRRVVDLKRIAFGGVELGDLPEGHFRPLSHREVETLRRAAMDAPVPVRAHGESGRPASRLPKPA
jgi:23S rRNA pseudouridine2605 synthase